MAKTVASKKAKGSRLEHKIAEMYRRYEIDPQAKRMLLSGGGYLKGDIYKPNDYRYLDECKNQERISLWQFWSQAEEQAELGRVPILHISSNNRPILTVMDADTYFDLRKTIMDLEKIISELRADDP